MHPVIITVAITGSVPRKVDNPAVPVTVAEQIESRLFGFLCAHDFKPSLRKHAFPH